MTFYFLLCAVITAISSFVSFGFSLAAARSAKDDARALALYAAVRSAALAIASLAALLLNSVFLVEAMACCMIFVQTGDAVVGLYIKDKMKTYGPAVTATFNLAALLLLFMHQVK